MKFKVEKNINKYVDKKFLFPIVPTANIPSSVLNNHL